LAVLWLFLPVITGSETLFLRDVFNTHLEMKWFQAEAMNSGTLPLVDTMRGGGQPHLGNPNTVPLYPDNLLYLLAPPGWALNAHFWIHLLLAPATFFALGRQWGLSKQASWTAGVLYATSGYYLSTLNLYNLTAGTTLAPLLVATFLALAVQGSGALALGAATATWSLLLLGGDPMTAAVAFGAALLAVAVRGPVGRRGLIKLAWAVGLGLLISAPQLVEFLRVLPGSYRGVQGYSPDAATVASWSPANLLEWLIPMVYGEPTMLFWGQRFHAGRMPLFHSLYPGLLALALIAMGWRGRSRAKRWIWAVLALGLFLVLGSYNPVTSLLLKLPGATILRLPVKFWILIAMALAMLAGFGAQRLLHGSGRRQLSGILGAMAGLMFLVAIGLQLAPVRDLLVGWLSGLPGDFASRELARWQASAMISGSFCVLGVLLCRLQVVGRAALVGGLLALHVVGQVWLLHTLVPTDKVESYREPSPLLDSIPEGARVVHGESGGLFGVDQLLLADYPDERLHWLQRETFERLYPPAGTMAGVRFEFWPSPEGLDSFLTRVTAQALPLLNDVGRLRLLEASGITHLLLGRELEGVEPERVRLVAEVDLTRGPLRLYELLWTAPEVQMVGRVLPATDPRAALSRVIDRRPPPRRRGRSLGGPGEW
jgi:hypothetical protein